MFVLDSHCDTPSQIFRSRDLSLDNPYSHIDFPKLLKGKVDGAFFALYVPSSYDSDPDAAFEYARRLYECVESTIEVNSNVAAFAASHSQALSNKADSLFSVFLGLENGSAIGKSFDRLKWFYDKGIRYVTLCHAGNNQICDSASTSVKLWGGLSQFGKELVVEMNRLGMLVDVSHISDEAFYDVMECSSKPVVATHSSCRALVDHPRNMTDDMIRAIAAKGGVVQVNFYPLFIDADFGAVLASSGIPDRAEAVESEFIASPSDVEKRRAWNKVQEELMSLDRPSYRSVVDHIDHIVRLVGVDHVGLGSDFDGIEVTPEGLEDVSKMPVIFDELRRRGYSEEDIAKIAGGNFFRVLNEASRL